LGLLPVKTVTHITYTVLVETLNPAQSLSPLPGLSRVINLLLSDLLYFVFIQTLSVILVQGYISTKFEVSTA